VGIEDQTDGVE